MRKSPKIIFFRKKIFFINFHKKKFLGQKKFFFSKKNLFFKNVQAAAGAGQRENVKEMLTEVSKVSKSVSSCQKVSESVSGRDRKCQKVSESVRSVKSRLS